ncbi:MAG: ABC transporter permease [Chryseolinea sp.]
MRTVRFLLQKEFRQIFRNRVILAMIVVMPTVQLMILPLAADFEVKNINLAVVDRDRSPYSQKLLSTITSSGYFKLVAYDNSYDESYKRIESDEADLILEVPDQFERDLVRSGASKLFVAVNAINGTKANLGGAYLNSIIQRYNRDIQVSLFRPGKFPASQSVVLTSSNWFNAHLNYRLFMVPGILSILVTMIGGFLSALNIVKEKEIGTIEQINVTPIRKHHFILGKLIPFWVLGNVVFSVGLIVSWLIYGIIPAGNLGLLYSFIGVYLLCVLGLGLLVSTFCETQQQAMFIMFFFMMIFILMSGLFTSTDGMPDWAKAVAHANPVYYLVDVMRMVVLKGSRFADIARHLMVVAALAVGLNTLAVLNYRKAS